MKRLHGIPFALFIAIVGCVRTQATLLSPSNRPAVNPDSVVIYTSADKVPSKYDEVALIDSHGDEALTSEHHMLESMRKQAGKVGANGLILNAVTDPGTGAMVAHTLIGTSANRKGKAIAIYVYPIGSDSSRASKTTQTPVGGTAAPH